MVPTMVHLLKISLFRKYDNICLSTIFSSTFANIFVCEIGLQLFGCDLSPDLGIRVTYEQVHMVGNFPRNNEVANKCLFFFLIVCFTSY